MFEKVLDRELLVDCKKAVVLEKKATARVLEYLTEIDRRKLWVKEGYSSLHDFCIRFLGYSEAEANRRIQAARLSSRVAEVKPLLESGSLSLTSLSLLSPVLTSENAKAILPQVISKPARAVEKFLAANFPETHKRLELFKVELDDEMVTLLEEAKLLASEKENQKLLKILLKNYLREKKTRTSSVKKHTRYVQASLAREVRKSAHYQCVYTGPNGIRCNQRAHLQTDHVQPWALGGSSQDPTNLRCLCRLHNLYLGQVNFPMSNYKLR